MYTMLLSEGDIARFVMSSASMPCPCVKGVVVTILMQLQVAVVDRQSHDPVINSNEVESIMKSDSKSLAVMVSRSALTNQAACQVAHAGPCTATAVCARHAK